MVERAVVKFNTEVHSDYPLNTKHSGIRTFFRYVRQVLLERFSTFARLAAGATHLKGWPSESVLPVPPLRVPFEVIEFDAHRVDCRLKIVKVDPLSVPTEYQVERVWLVVLVDVFSRAVLGYQIVCNPEISRFDVICTVELRLKPHARQTLFFRPRWIARPAAAFRPWCYQRAATPPGERQPVYGLGRLSPRACGLEPPPRFGARNTTQTRARAPCPAGTTSRHGAGHDFALHPAQTRGRAASGDWYR